MVIDGNFQIFPKISFESFSLKYIKARMDLKKSRYLTLGEKES